MADLDEQQQPDSETQTSMHDEGGGEDDDEKPVQHRDPLAVEERMRVDRRKLERMLQAGDECSETAEAFFERVMRQTETTINWPSKLKIGAKSKKDPHIKVTGRSENVRQAKEMVTAVLDTKSNRVTLKMDVSHLEHSHVIGKGGVNIKRVMEETSCHIHFPDSNRSKQFDKSNQVSIAGQPQGVEAARRRIRELLPLTLTCELPITSRGMPDSNDAAVKLIADTYQVNITFRPRPRMYTFVVIVRGYVSSSSSVKEATAHVIEQLFGEPAHSVMITIQMDIAPQHHLFMIGRNGLNIKHIMSRTGANIQFPDVESAQRNKSTVFITGNIDSVCLAREQLIGCLPLVLMFDLKDETGAVMNDIAGLSQLMETLDVFISIKPKPKQLSKSVIVKTVERNSHNMYYARVYLLERDPSSKADSDSPVGTAHFSYPVEHLEKTLPVFAPTSFLSSARDIQLQSLRSEESNLSEAVRQGRRIPSGLAHINQGMMDLSLSTGSTSTLSLSSSGFDLSDSSLSLSSSGHSLSADSPRKPLRTQGSPYHGQWPPTHLPNMDLLRRRALLRDVQESSIAMVPGDTDLGDSGLGQERLTSSNSCGSTTRLNSNHNSPVRLPLTSASPLCDDGLGFVRERNDCFSNVVGSRNSVSPDGSHHSFSDSPILSHMYERASPAHQKSPGMAAYPDKHMTLARCDAIGTEQQGDYEGVDYERKRKMASEAMKKPVITQEVRIPTDIWSGMGFSRSMPESAIREQLRRLGKTMKEPSMATAFEAQEALDFLEQQGQYDPLGVNHARRNLTREFDFGPVGTPASDGHGRKASLRIDDDLAELLCRIGLSKYATLFQDQEVDLNTFLTLGDRDLKELGVSTFGARKKMLLAIADIQGQPLGSQFQDTSRRVEDAHHAGWRKYPYSHAIGSRRDMMSMSGRW
ncbi:protein bicaudal C homolog 1-like [Corticium candelabrum]|uniref:protein bicaudal C homolog 1-like n=1 Tax=Corticium candelabrum TaxID=121492 RepID=UPI002E261C6F|nr:protein bicaudal C homolog 1-like [Corticium candelabrum]